MTSRISYSKLLKEDLRHHLTIMVVNVVVLLLHVLSFAMSIQNSLANAKENKETSEEIITRVAELSQPSIFFAMAVVLLGVYAAIEGFRFLHSKRQMDFYGSLPITRGRRFAVSATGAVVMFLIPLVLNGLIRSGIVATTGYGSKEAYTGILFSVLCLFATFLITFATTILAMVMTGNTFIAFLGVNVFFWYVPAVRFLLYSGYCQTFFTTYVSSDVSDGWYCFSPATIIFRLFTDFSDKGWKIANQGIWFVPLLIFTAVMLVLSYVLYRRRAAETAGKAMAFAKVNPILRFLIVVPISLFAGLLLCILSFDGSVVWLLIGIIIGCIFTHALMECIFEFDIRAMFHHKWHLVVSLAAALFITMLFALDVTGYDTYVPKAGQVKAVIFQWDDIDSSYTVEDLKQAEKMPEEVREKALSFATLAMKENKAANKIINGNSNNILFDFIAPETSLATLKVSYVMEDGSLKQRNYYLRENFDYSALEDCFNLSGYKQSMNPIIENKFKNPASFYWYDVFNGEELRLSEEQLREVAKAYQKDYANLTYEEMRAKGYVGTIELMHDSMFDSGIVNYPVYPSYTNTMASLETCGLKIGKLEDYTITTLQISKYQYQEESAEDAEVETVEITDAEIIARYRDKLYIQSGVSYWTGRESISYDIYATVKDESGEEETDVWLSADEKVCEELMKLGKSLSPK